MVYEGDEPGGERCTVLTAGRETDVQRCVPSIVDEKIGAVVVAQSGTGTELGSSDPAVQCKNSDRGCPDQAHKHWSDISVPKKNMPSWQDIYRIV